MESENKQSGDLYTLLGWLDQNKNTIIAVAIAVVIAGVAYFYYDYRKSERTVEAGQQLSTVMLAGNGATPTADALLKVAEDTKGTEAGARALLTAAGKQFVDGKIDEAKNSFQRFVTEYPESSLMNQAKYGIAVCLEAQGKTAEATTAFKEVMDRYAGDNTTSPAKFALARIYEADGKLEQARDYYMDLARDPRSTFGMEAGSRVMALFQKHPNLRPTSTSAMNRTAVAPTP